MRGQDKASAVFEFLQFMWLCCHSYRSARKHGTHYAAIISHGVPTVCCFVGLGREAWRVSQRAIEELKP